MNRVNGGAGPRWLKILQAVALLLCAVLLTAVFGHLKHQIAHALAGATPSGNRLSPARLRLLVRAAEAASILLLGLLALSLFFRASFEAYLGGLESKWRASYVELTGDLRSYFTSFSAVSFLSLIILFISGTALRIHYLFQPMRYDESLSFDEFASKPLGFLIRDYTVPNNHVFHNILVHFTTRLLGEEPWAIRLPALVAGCLIIPVAALVFRHFFGNLVGLLAAALVAGNSILMEYSINSRGYSILTLIFLLLLGLTDYLRRRDNLAAWLIFIGLAAIGFYTIPTMLYPFGMLICWLLLSSLLRYKDPESRRLIAHILLAAVATLALTFILYSPIILYHGIKPLVANQYVAPLTWSQFLLGWPESLRKLWIQWNRGLPKAIGIALSAGVVLFFALGSVSDRHKIGLLIVSLLSCVFAVCVQRVIPFERVWIFLVPLYLALAAAGFVATVRRVVAADGLSRPVILLTAPALLLLLVSIFVVSSNSVVKSGEAFPEVYQVTEYFDNSLQPGDHIVAMCPDDCILLYYARRHPKLDHSLHDDARHPCSQVLIVVRNSDQTAAGVLRENRVVTAEFDNPHVIKEFANTTIYVAQRRVP